MIEEPQFVKETVGREFTDLAFSSSDWSVLSGKLWLMDVHVARPPRAPSNSALTVLFTTMNLLL